MADSQRNEWQRARGFSLAELLAALAVSAALSAVALPNLLDLSAEYQLARAAHQLAFEISRARMKAVGENAYCRLRIGLAPDGRVAYWLEESEDGLVYHPEGSPVPLPSLVSLESTSETLPQFDRQGLSPAASAITLANHLGQRKTVTASVVGRVAVQ